MRQYFLIENDSFIMKKIFFKIYTTVLIFSCASLNIILGETICDMVEEEVFFVSHHGRHLPEEGEVKALVIYVQFPDDDYTDNIPWPLDEYPDAPLGNDYLAPNVDNSGNSYRDYSISDYFYKMSNGQYHVYGDVYPSIVYTTHTSQWYRDNNKHFGHINKQVLLSLDNSIDFSDYDNWTVNGVSSFQNIPDGEVDMIFIIYRRLFCYEDSTPHNCTHFGLTGHIARLSLLNVPNIQTNDNVTINMQSFPQSGVTITKGYRMTESNAVSVWAHEYSHYLFGAFHIGGFGKNGLMEGWYPGRPHAGWQMGMGMHSQEKFILGYLDFIDGGQDGVYYLQDYLTSNDAIKVPLPNDESFTIEYRQQISIYDREYNSGLIISHIKNNRVDIECADSNWNWEFCEPDKIQRESTLVNGIDGLDIIYVNGNVQDYKSDVDDLCEGESVQVHGDDVDSWNVGYKTLFATWTSPNTVHGWNNDNSGFTDISIELLEMNNVFAVISINHNSPPKTPSSFRITGRIGQKAKPKWAPNNEQDHVGYKLYRKLDGQTDFSLLVTLPANATSYTDNDVTIARFTPAQAYYYITAFDNQQNFSENSPSKWVSYNPFKQITRNQSDSTFIDFPLKIDNQWLYIQYFDSSYIYKEITGDTIDLDGVYWFKYGQSGPYRRIVDSSYVYEKSHLNDNEKLIYKLNTFEGDCWEVDSVSVAIVDNAGYNDYINRYFLNIDYLSGSCDSIYFWLESVELKGGLGETEFLFEGSSYSLLGAIIDGEEWGTFLSNSINETPLPQSFKLHQPYPNPFNPATTIRFSAASTQSLQIQIFDITGRLVETLIDEPLTQGEHEIVWNAGSQPSGVYFVRLQSGEFVQNQKVILLK